MADAQGNIVGSRLIAQPFSSAKYFHPRPSAVSYNAAATGGSNWGASNPNLRKRVADHPRRGVVERDAVAARQLHRRGFAEPVWQGKQDRRDHDGREQDALPERVALHARNEDARRP